MASLWGDLRSDVSGSHHAACCSQQTHRPPTRAYPLHTGPSGPPTYPPTGPTRSTGDLPPGALPLSRRMLDARAHFKIAAAKMVRHQASWAAWRVGSYAGSSLGPMAPHSTRWYTWLTAAKKTQSSMEHGTVHGNLGNGTKAQRRRMPKTRELLEDGQYSVYTRG